LLYISLSKELLKLSVNFTQKRVNFHKSLSAQNMRQDEDQKNDDIDKLAIEHSFFK